MSVLWNVLEAYGRGKAAAGDVVAAIDPVAHPGEKGRLLELVEDGPDTRPGTWDEVVKAFALDVITLDQYRELFDAYKV